MNALANSINAYTYAVAFEKFSWGLAGLVIGVLLTAVINGMAKRDDFVRRLDAFESDLDEIDDDLESVIDRLDSIDEPKPHDPPSKADVDAALGMLTDEDEPATWPTFKPPHLPYDHP